MKSTKTIPTKVAAPKGPPASKSYPYPASGGGQKSGGKTPSGGVINTKIKV